MRSPEVRASHLRARSIAAPLYFMMWAFRPIGASVVKVLGTIRVRVFVQAESLTWSASDRATSALSEPQGRFQFTGAHVSLACPVGGHPHARRRKSDLRFELSAERLIARAEAGAERTAPTFTVAGRTFESHARTWDRYLLRSARAWVSSGLPLRTVDPSVFLRHAPRPLRFAP